MSSSEPRTKRTPPAGATRLALAALLGCGLLASACTVRPLYGDAVSALGPDAGVSRTLPEIGIKPPRDRVDQQVRNQLLFLLNGGGREPASPRYSLDLGVSYSTAAVAVIQVARQDEPTAAIVTVISSYAISDETGEVVIRGRRQASASYDVPRQAFAALRAERDAQDRAARELAESLRLAIAQDFARPDGFLDTDRRPAAARAREEARPESLRTGPDIDNDALIPPSWSTQ